MAQGQDENCWSRSHSISQRAIVKDDTHTNSQTLIMSDRKTLKEEQNIELSNLTYVFRFTNPFSIQNW